LGSRRQKQMSRPVNCAYEHLEVRETKPGLGRLLAELP
jgi:hypothetical protein